MLEAAESMVLIDSDFLIKMSSNLSEWQNHFTNLMGALGKKPVVHEYVYSAELSLSGPIQELFASGDIEIIYYEDFLSNPLYCTLYASQVQDLYSHMNNGKQLSFSKPEDLFKIRLAGSNLGEIHSMLLANFEQIPIICSNDHGTKDLKNYLGIDGSRKLEVFDSYDLIVELGRSNKHTCIPRDVALNMVTYSTRELPPNRADKIKQRNKARRSKIKELYRT